MAWDHLSINRPHLVYIILGGFTSLFMLCSSVIKERLYIGEATVATLVGIIFGPYAANLIDPMKWGNTDQITLEFSRIVLVVQCFAVGVELPKSYMERHWKSVTLLLVPVMTFGWLVTSVFIYWMFLGRMNWLDSLCVAACVTATDPVLASSVVGKGKFAKRVPKHLRDLLSAESGCNDGMAFPFIYLAVYLMQYHLNAEKFAFKWFCYTILYECIFGAVFGVIIGYSARRAIRFAHERDLIDRESFLVFYFVLALFCAGSGSILGMDDLLVGFAAGVGFSNDGWFQEKTEEAHVSNVIDLLINLAFFVYFGTIIPWNQFNSDIIGTAPWRLVVVAVFVMFFRRIPIMLALKPIIPDIKTWREALFAGHFGPIGVGALFIAILARAELETGSTTPLAVLPEPGFEYLNVIELIWPITCFLVICSIVVHGSSIAVFTLGKHINTLTLTFSYTTAVEEGPSWMERLPRIQSRSKSSMSLRRTGSSETSLDEKAGENGISSPLDIPRNFLRRQKEEDVPSAPRRKRKSRKGRWDQGIGPGGPISQSAITPAPRQRSADSQRMSDPALVAVDPNTSPSPEGSESRSPPGEPQEEIYQEGDHTIIEDEEGNVLSVRESPGEETDIERIHNDQEEAKRVAKEKNVQHGVAQTEHGEARHELPRRHSSAADMETAQSQQPWWKQMDRIPGGRRISEAIAHRPDPQPQQRRGPARAYTFGNTVIVEDEDGEVIKQYQIPTAARPVDRKASFADGPAANKTREVLQRMGYYLGAGGAATGQPAKQGESSTGKERDLGRTETDDHIRFQIGDGGRRLRKEEFIKELQKLDSKSRARVVESQDAPEQLKTEVKKRAAGEDLEKTTSLQPEPVPSHAVADTLASFAFDRGGRETAAQRRRRQADERAPPTQIEEESASSSESGSDEEDEGPSGRRPPLGPRYASDRDQGPSGTRSQPSYLEEVETEAEKRRRQAALGLMPEEDSSDEEAPTAFRSSHTKQEAGSSSKQPAFAQGGDSSQASRAASSTNIRFAEENPRASGPRLRWGEDVKKP